MKKKTKQSTASMPEDTIPLLSEYESDLEESKTFNPKKATKSPAAPNKSFLHKGKHGTLAEDTIPLLSEYEGDLEEFGTVSPTKTTKGLSVPKIPNSSISYSKLKNEDDVSAKKAPGSSSSSDLGSDSGVGSSTSSSKTSVRKGIKTAIKKTITAFNKNAKKEQASSSPSGAQPTTWYVNPLDVSDVDNEPGQAKHWAQVEDLLGDEFDTFARSRLSSVSASSDFEFRTGEQYYSAIDRQSDSVIEPIYETLDPHWKERANVAPEPAYNTPRSTQPVSKNAAARAEPAYDTPRNSQQVSENAAAKAEPIYETIDQFRHEHAGTAKGPTIASQTRSAAPSNAQAGNRPGQMVVNGSIYDVPDPVAAYDTPRNLKPVSKNAAARAEPHMILHKVHSR
ncbi:hypothetical protein [Anaplasma marginale]|uniref:hypothetical protein n=1 Tax=Anaplasma marginale TaxID=770 RepID=UPI001F079589|nr:hypothetical protein [Anaplasma marginale]